MLESLFKKAAGQSPPPAQLLSCEYCEIFKNIYFEEHLRTAGCFWKRNLYELIFKSVKFILPVIVNSNKELLRPSENP